MTEHNSSYSRNAPLESLDYRLALVLTVAAALIFLPGLFYGLPGKGVAGAVRILQGEVPYRDFWTVYAPGMFYASAAVFRVFGQEFLTLGVVSLLLDSLVIGVMFLLLRRVTDSRPAAFVLAFVFIGAFWTTGREILSYEPALFFLLLSWHGILSYLRGGGLLPLFYAGLSAGLAACFKHDVTAYVVFAAVASLFLSWLLTGDRRPSHWSTPITATLTLAAGALITFLPPAVWIAWQAGADAWQNLFVFPATIFSKVMVWHYPPLLPPLGSFWTLLQDFSVLAARGVLSSFSEWILCNVPQYVFVVTIFVLIRRRRSLVPSTLATILMFLIALPLFWSAAHLQQNTHVLSMALLGFLLGGMAWTALQGLTNRILWARRALVAGCGLVAVGIWLPPAMDAYVMQTYWKSGQYLDLPRAQGIRVPARIYEAYRPIIKFLQANTHEDERIYVGLTRHDAIVDNDMLLQVLAGRRSCCRYSEIHRGVVDVADGQREIIHDLERHQVRAVVLWKFGWSDATLDRRLEIHKSQMPEIGSVVLDEYITQHFDLLAQYGEYLLMWRKDIPKPRRVPP